MAKHLVAILYTLQILNLAKGQLGSPLTTAVSAVGLPGAIAEGIARTTGKHRHCICKSCHWCRVSPGYMIFWRIGVLICWGRPCWLQSLAWPWAWACRMEHAECTTKMFLATMTICRPRIVPLYSKLLPQEDHPQQSEPQKSPLVCSPASDNTPWNRNNVWGQCNALNLTIRGF